MPFVDQTHFADTFLDLIVIFYERDQMVQVVITTISRYFFGEQHLGLTIGSISVFGFSLWDCGA